MGFYTSDLRTIIVSGCLLRSRYVPSMQMRSYTSPDDCVFSKLALQSLLMHLHRCTKIAEGEDCTTLRCDERPSLVAIALDYHFIPSFAVFSSVEFDRKIHSHPSGSQSYSFLFIHVHSRIVPLHQRYISSLSLYVLNKLLSFLDL